MGKTYILNIEHDLALANGQKNYIPPKVAVDMNRDLSTLPLWYADKNSTIISDNDFEQKEILESLGIKCNICSWKNYKAQEDEFVPWGWDQSMTWKLSKKGIDVSQNINIEKIKELSHRRISIKILQAFADKGLFSTENLPQEVFTEEELKTLCEQKKGLLKAPLSGSGRGLCWARDGYDNKVERWSKKVLKEQGSLIFEPVWQKKDDYAMEFYSDGNVVKFAGYSFFSTDLSGVYRCNILTTNKAIETQIEHDTNVHMKDIKDVLEKFLTEHIAPYYKGYMGVDMLTGELDGILKLNPCVELNLRMTMGMVARAFYDKYVAPGRAGEYKTIHFKTEGELMMYVKKEQEKNPVIIKDKKIEKGYMLLTCCKHESLYGVEIKIN